MPISTLYASPEKISSDLFCAFQPNRVTVPSLPLVLSRPEMPSWFLAVEFDATLAAIVESLIASIIPAPNTGVGMRKMMFLAATCASKSSCLMLQPVAPGAPVITNRACTPPSGEPSGFLTKRASRTGPFLVMNDGGLFPASNGPVVAKVNCGLTSGELPPVAGWAWQPPQLSRLKRGPTPSATSSADAKSSLPSSKNATSPPAPPGVVGGGPGGGRPGPAGPPRTPGSSARN